MANYQEARVNLTNTQLNKLKSAANSKTEKNTKKKQEKLWRWRIAIWVISTNKTNNENKKCFCCILLTDIKLSKAQISKIIQSGGSFGSWLGNLGKKALTNKAIPLAKDNLPGLVSNLASNAINLKEK